VPAEVADDLTVSDELVCTLLLALSGFWVVRESLMCGH
jgi:hypothetical protein